MDRAYVLPCQKSNFKSCEGCPEIVCEKKHFIVVEPEKVYIEHI